MFSRSRSRSSPTIPHGHRVYAIGDVHGEARLLHRALRLIRDDNAARRAASVTLVFLGDIIDRGPDAAALLETFARMPTDNVVVLKGNHEEALVEAYHGDDRVLDQWLPFGAMATLTGFGVTLKEIDSSNAKFAAALRSRIDPDLIAWLTALPSTWESGGYYFTHAGVRPGVDLADQDDADLRWIREPFLSSRRDHGKVVVHGHTVEPGVPRLGGNRIGIDTGAHEHGVLTALGLEGERQWLLQATGKDSGASEAAADDSERMRDIVALIRAIVTREAAPSDPTPLLRTAGRTAGDGEAKRTNNSGYVVAGFALVLAAVGGGFALWPKMWPGASGNVTMSIPEDMTPQVAVPRTTTATTDPASNRSETPEPRPSRRPAAAPTIDAATANAATPEAADGASPRLYGEALEKALEEDRALTRRLNEGELSRQREARDATK